MFARQARLGAVTDGTVPRPLAEAILGLRISCLPAIGRVMPASVQNSRSGEMPGRAVDGEAAPVRRWTLRQACTAILRICWRNG